MRCGLLFWFTYVTRPIAIVYRVTKFFTIISKRSLQ